MASTDGTMGVVPAMLAERLGLPAGDLRLRADRRRTARSRSAATATPSTQTIEATLPALVSVTDQINEPRYPSFKGIMAAKKKPVEQWALADLGIDPSQVGLDAAWTKVESFAARPPREQGQIVADEGDGGSKLAAFLAEQQVRLSPPDPSQQRRSAPWLKYSFSSTTPTGKVRKTTAELLTIARRLGEPSAVFVGAGFDAAKETLAAYGAEKVYRVESRRRRSSYLVAPQAELLAAARRDRRPRPPCSSRRTAEGKEIAARLAVKTESGLITDAVDVQAGDDGGVATTQSVFAGSYTVTATVTKGTPIVAVKPNSATPEEARRPRPPTRSFDVHPVRRRQGRAGSPSPSRSRPPAAPS